MMAWMDALTAFTPARRAELLPLPQTLSSEMTMLLADMVITCQEVTR